MTYTIDESLSDGEYTAAGDVAGVFGTPRRYESITIHHWGVFGQTHNDVVDFFVNRNRNTSAHFVVSDGRINCLVSPANAAWAAGNAYGNATSIHIECHPEATSGDYATVAWLVSFLRANYGANLPLRPHNSWSATACPGIWDLSRVDREARAVGTAIKPAPKPAPKPVKAPVKAPAPKPATTGLSWIVERGDTLGGIAGHYGITVTKLATANGIKNVNALKVGQRLTIPGPLVWTVDPGDTLAEIAAHYGMAVSVLAAKNGIKNPNALSVGQVIKVL